MAPMSLAEALEVLGVAPGTPMAEVRAHYRRLVRTTHPDLGHDPSATVRTSRITVAFATVRAAVTATGSEVVPAPADSAPRPQSAPPRSAPPQSGQPRSSTPPPPGPPPDDVGAAASDADTITIEVPAPEAFALLLDAAARIGAVGYVDRHLGLLEILVRFEGGPTCSVLTTLQGRAHGTEVFCTMDSIEAAPAPPIRPVVDALVEALHHPH